MTGDAERGIAAAGPGTEPAPHAAWTLWVVGADGRVAERRGHPRGPEVGSAFEPGVAAAGGALQLIEPEDGPDGGGRLVAAVEAGSADLAGGLLRGWADSDAARWRAERDIESMSETGAALMEAASMYGDLMRRLGSSEESVDAYRLGALSLAVAGRFRDVAYVTIDGDTAEVVAEVRFDAASQEHAIVDEADAGRRFDARRGALALLAASHQSSVVQRVAERADDVPERSPEAAAEQDVLAAELCFSSQLGDRQIGAVLCVDRLPDDYRSGQAFGSVECDLADNVNGMVALRVGSTMLAGYRRELSLAHDIQRQILPDAPPQVGGYELAGSCRAFGDVGGDYLDYLPMADGRTLALVADVSGHNLASGMIMVGARSAIRVLAAAHTDPGRVFTGLLETLYPDLNRTERFITAAAIALRPDTDEIEIVNAGHNPTLIYRARSGAVERVFGDDPILGLLPGLEYGTRALALEAGDVALLYTDGVTEAAKPDGEMFGEERLEAILVSGASNSPAELLTAVYSSLSIWTDAASIGDDVTVVAVKRLRPARRDAR